MTVEELEIIVTAKVEEALKEFKKVSPEVKRIAKQTQENFEKMDTETFKRKVQNAVQYVKNKVVSLKQNNKNNEIKITVNNEEAKKQLTQVEKEIDALQKKISARQIKLNMTNSQMESTISNTRREVVPEGVKNKDADYLVDKALSSNKDFSKLDSQAKKLSLEIEIYNQKLNEAKSKMVELKSQISQTSASQSKLASFFNAFKSNIGQVSASTKNLRIGFNQLPKITQYVTNNIKKMSMGVKQGLSHVLKYAGALLGLRSIYNILRNSANSWLSSQNAGAQQLNANIEYMKYAMGSALAPVITWVTNLIYQLLRALQSVVYMFSRINIFAKATASSMKSASGSAKQASKSLAGVHSEINNVSEKDNSGGAGDVAPTMDLSNFDPTNSLIEKIKNANWEEVGESIGEKLNSVMAKITWGKIQNGARSVGKNIANFLNGGIKSTNWYQVGNTFAQALNTIIYFGYEFVTNFNWGAWGKSIGENINGLIANIDWAAAAQTLSEGLIGLLQTINGVLETTDWKQIGEKIKIFLMNVNWKGIATEVGKLIGNALGALVLLIVGMLGDFWKAQWEKFKSYGQNLGDNIILGIIKGFLENMKNAWQWVYDSLVKPLIDAFCKRLGIHSPSTVFAEFGKNIVEGLFQGINNLIGNVVTIWTDFKNNVIKIFGDVKNSIGNKVSEIKNGMVSKFQEAYNNIKSIFNNIGSFFTGVWDRVKNTFSNLGTNIGNAISSSVKAGINTVITMIENTMNRAIRMINGSLNIINAIPGVNIPWMNYLSIPRLAKGGILTEPTMVLAGEYSGAKSNPEIFSPKNMMYDTMVEALSDVAFGNSGSGQPLRVQVYIGTENIVDEVIDGINEKTRQTGKAQIKVAYA